MAESEESVWASVLPEIMESVMQLLNPGDLASSAAVNRHWRKVAGEKMPPKCPYPWLLMASASGSTYLEVHGGAPRQHPYIPGAPAVSGSSLAPTLRDGRSSGLSGPADTTC